TEVRRTDGTSVPCPSATLLASTLRRSFADNQTNHTVHTGAIISADRIVTGRTRTQLAQTGALAVDMESAWLLAKDSPNGAPPEPAAPAVACVRVIADPATGRLLRTATLSHVLTAIS